MKRLINKAIFLEQLKRFWPIAALSMLAYLLFIIQPLYFPSATAQRGSSARIVIQLLSMSHPMMLIAMIAVPFITALAFFSYPYRVTSATAYHALPVSRKQLFITHGLAGFTLILSPLLILSLALLVPVVHVQGIGLSWNYFQASTVHGETINTVSRVIGFFIRNVLGFTMYFALFVLAASLAGNKVIAVLLSGVLVFAPMGLVGLFEVIGSYYVFGFGAASLNAMEVVATHTQPIGWMVAYEGWQYVARAPLFISFSVITVVCFGIAFFANKIRPHERAGDTVAFLAVKRVLIFLFALAGMAIMGVFWLNAVGSRFGYYIGFVIGFVIAYFIAQMIAEKTFRVGDKAKQLISYAAVAAGLYAMLLLVTVVGLWGYTRRVPSEQEITGVIIEQANSFRGQGRIVRVYPEGMVATHGDRAFIEDPATIARIREVHENIVSERAYLQRSRWRDPSFSGGWTTPINITYRLENGRIIHRSYILTRNLHSNLRIHSLMQSGHVALSQIPALFAPEVMDSISITIGNTRHTVRTPHRLSDLTDMLRADILSVGSLSSGNISVNLDINERYISQQWGRTWFHVPSNGYTAAWMRENGFID